jgi:pyruvyl transferase EpsI
MRENYYDRIAEKYKINKGKTNIFIIGTPVHGNLGDHAIAYATYKILSEVMPDKNISEINMNDFCFDIDAIYNIISSEDIIILQGGGNFGNIYMNDEVIRRYVISRFKNNKIIMFPQSVYFSNNEEGKKELEKSIEIYSANKNLYLFTRDHNSYMFLKSRFNNPVFDLEDSVLAINKSNSETKRNGVLCCLRNDAESKFDEKGRKEIIDLLKSKYSNVIESDTVVDYDFKTFNREDELNKKWNEFKQAKLVVTDRLHGMVFAAITSTPCVVFPSINSKMTDEYKTIDTIRNIKYVEDIAELDKILLDIDLSSEVYYSEDGVLKLFFNALNSIMNLDITDCEYDCNKDIFEIASYWSDRYYETKYWKNKIGEVYDNLESNYKERIKELQSEIQTIERQNALKFREIYEFSNAERERTEAIRQEMLHVIDDKNQLDALFKREMNSMSYRIGRAITYIPRKIAAVIRKLKFRGGKE